LIENSPILDRASPKHSFSLVAGLLERSARRDVLAKRNGEHPHETELIERVRRDELDRGRGDPATPIVLANPVAELCADSLDVGADVEADAADRSVVDVDREARLLGIPQDTLDVLRAVRFQEGVRETITKIQPDLSIRAVIREVYGVTRPIAAHDALRRVKFHGAKLSAAISANQMLRCRDLARRDLARLDRAS
jgi:hypothetical protein